MHGNKLSDRLPASLMNLTNLQILQLNENELVGSIPTWLGIEVSLLRLVNLKSNHFYGNIPHEICYLTHIQILVLADNNKSRNILGCFNNFSFLSGKETTLDDPFIYSIGDIPDFISSDSLVMKGREDTYSTILRLVTLLNFLNNNISGDIPSELTALATLQSLNLSRNQLTCRISKKIGNMKALVSCDLSVNKLYGELPMSLSSLSLLSSFNVSYKNLTGRIPLSTQLQSFNETSFFGNKLCGDPLIEQCARVEAPNTTNHEEDNESHTTDWALVILAWFLDSLLFFR